MIQIPTNTLREKIVEQLPVIGEENIVYRRLIDPKDEYQFTEDFIWYNDEYHPFSFDVKIYGAYFERYQESVAEEMATLQNTIAILETRIEELEGKGGILFEGDSIELTEAGATIGLELDVTTDIVVSDGTVFKVTLTDMTIDGEPIADVSGEITAYELSSWNWQGGDLYDETFGNSAYFSFGTKPMNDVATKVTLGFVNEGDGFPVRTLVIGHIKVEVK